MTEAIFSIVKNSLAITFFVLAMMLFIEYVNVATSGAFCEKIKQRGWQQVLIGVLFGVLPGCLGTYTVVTLFTHNLVSFGALFATFVATMGDEAFLLFSIDIKTALFVTAVLVGIAIVGGYLIDLLYHTKQNAQDSHFEIHKHVDDEHKIEKSSLIKNVIHASPHRALLLFGVLLIFVLSVLGEIGHSHDILPMEIDSSEHEHSIDWFSITFILISIVAAYVISVVSEHFLEEHFWNHIIKKHFFKILGWTTCIIALVHILDHCVALQDYITQYPWQILLLAIFVGLIPESGPHIIFISLYLSGTIPFYVLLANSLVQDGHGGLPLLAEKPKMFVAVKVLKCIIALLFGSICLTCEL